MKRLAILLLPLASWGLLAYGASLVYGPAGWIVAGACLWVDLYLGHRLRRTR